MTATARRSADGVPAVEVIHIGRERQPVVIVDGATGIAGRLVEQAAAARFSAAQNVGSHYPGLLGPAPTAYLDGMVRAVLPLINLHFGTGPVRPARARGNFSLVTAAPETLTSEQRLPHVDTVDALQFATVHFLCGEDMGGTGFFRHCATGYETLDADRLPTYRAALDAELADFSPPPQYIDMNGNTLFEGIAAITPKFDRLILYRAGLLHSGLIPAVPEHAVDPRRGRLTGNLFLQCRPA